jgi:hypothetical protein
MCDKMILQGKGNTFYVRREEMKPLNATETAVALARENERLQLLRVAEESKDLKEFIEYLKKLLSTK